MSKFANEFIGLVNQLREDPESFVEVMEKYMSYIDNKKVMRIPGKNAGIQLNEGKAAYQKAIAQLKKAPKNTPALTKSKGLMGACKQYVGKLKDAADPDTVEDFSEVMDQYGSFTGSLSNLSEFGGESPEHVLTNLLAQDGSSEKSNIQTFTSNKFTVMGVSFNEHCVYRFCTFIAMATKFNEK